MKHSVPLAPLPNLREIDVAAKHLSQVNEQRAGSCRTFIAKNAYIDALLQRKYRREGLCLKVFRSRKHTTRRLGWEGVRLNECCRVQNLFAWEGLAPRIYDLVTVAGRVAQVTDYLEPEPGRVNRAAFDHVCEKHGLEPKGRKHRYKNPPHNWVGGKLVDFGGLRFADPVAYEQGLRERALYQNHDKMYQGALGEAGMRDLAHRLEVLRFDEVDFAGKTVLDVGCNLGAFTREALKRGAARVVGVDKVKARAAYELSNWLGEWRADFLPLSLPNQWGEVEVQTGIERFDVILDLAVVGHTGGLPPLDCDLLIFEGHRHTREHYEPMLEERFSSVEFLGHTTDMGKRPVFRCRGDAT